MYGQTNRKMDNVMENARTMTVMTRDRKGYYEVKVGTDREVDQQIC